MEDLLCCQIIENSRLCTIILTFMSKQYCYLNGKIVPTDKAGISVSDLGVLRGYGLYEGVRIYGGKPFLLDMHYKRLQGAAKLLSLKIPITLSELEKQMQAVAKKSGIKEGVARIILTGGPAIDGLKLSGKPTFYILVETFHFLPKSEYEKGVKLLTHEFERYLPQAKTTNYIEVIRQQKRCKAAKAFELLYVSRGKVLEATNSNFFLIKGNTLITAKDGVLPGTTRGLLLKLAKKDFKIEEREISIKEISEADEAFITGAFKEILPVIQVDEIKVGDGKVGEKTKLLIRLFGEYVKKY